MRRWLTVPLLILVATAVLAVPGTALAAPGTMSYSATGPKVTYTPAGSTASVNVSTFRFKDFFCGGFPFPPCQPEYWEISEAQGMSASSCNDTVDGDNRAYRCGTNASTFPNLATLTGTAGNDTISSGQAFFCSGCAPLALTANGLAGNDTISNTTGGNDTLTGGPGNDTISGGGGANDTVNGDDGDDTLSTSATASTVNGGNGDDKIDTGGGADVIEGGDGNDTIDSGAGNDTVNGGNGKDNIKGGAGDDTLDGGDSNDTLDGGDGNDTLKGGPRRDLLTPGLGTDTIEGGESKDTVSYEERTTGTTIAIGGGPVSGESGENDTIASDVENVIGGSEADRITGDGGANDIDAGPGNDTINPGGGTDFVEAGAGDDIIEARDGTPDRIECGPGNDRAVTDEFDSTLDCEVVEASRDLMSDVDNDGIAAPIDCDDRDPERRPGIVDRPGDGKDQDCSGSDAKFPQVTTGVQFSFKGSRGRLRFTRLVLVDIAPSTSVEIRCKGGTKRGCFKGTKKKKYTKAREKGSLLKLVKKQKLKRSARLEIRILRPDTIAKVVTYKSRGAKAPSSTIRCIRPGSKKIRKC